MQQKPGKQIWRLVAVCSKNMVHGGLLIHPLETEHGTQSHGGLAQMIFLFNCVMFRFDVNFEGSRF